MPPSLRNFLLSLLALSCLLPDPSGAGPIEDRLAEAYGGVDPRLLETGVLYDRVLPLSGIERFDGSRDAATTSAGRWIQLYDELRRAGPDRNTRPLPDDVIASARSRHDAIPIGLIFDRYERLRSDAINRGLAEVRDGQLRVADGAAFEARTAFAAAALRSRTWRGGDVRFMLPRDLFFSNASSPLTDLAIDLGDGRGFRPAHFDELLAASYPEPGTRTIRVQARAGGEELEASTAFVVSALAAPLPDDTLHVTGTIPYLGGVASGDAYIYLAAGHTSIVNPAVAVEGFDLDNTMNWDELYALLNTENLLESLRADGYDIVVLNFADATDYIERNAMLLVELLQELRAAIPPGSTMGLAGASMGGLVSRYALAYMETHALPHSTRTYLSFDAPHLGANIPLGVQHWVRFFAGQSTDAAYLLSRLDRPAAKEMLVYHYTQPPGATGQPDPLRATFLSNLAAARDWPNLTRNVAIANGSGTGAGEPFAAGAQIVQWSYSDLFVTILGNVWAAPNVTSTKIFDGRLRILFSNTQQTVTVSNTAPYDNAPGGWRSSMADMDATAAPYGDIVALYPNHCFIPTLSALAYSDADLFHAVSGDADPLAHTPFDAIYWPASNQEHVTVTAQNAAWIRGELELGVTRVATLPGTGISFARPEPNPSAGTVRMSVTLPRAATIDLRVLGVDGREVARLASGTWAAGPHQIEWAGVDRRGAPAPPGIYFVRLAADGTVETRRIARLR